VLLTAGSGRAWRAAASCLAIDAAGPLTLGPDGRDNSDPDGTFARTFGPRGRWRGPSSAPTGSSPGGRSAAVRTRRRPSRPRSPPRWAVARISPSLKERRLRDAPTTHHGGGRLGRSLPGARLRRSPRLSPASQTTPCAVSTARGVVVR
jgi:hypothetical protein